MTASTYSDETGWRSYAAVIPSIDQVAELAVEERWPWRHSRIHIDRIPNADAPVKALLVHGIGAYGRLVMGAFGVPLAEAGVEVVAPDLPGFGLTVVEKRQVTFGAWVSCLVDLIDRESADGRPLVLVGFSLGGTAAYHAAAARPSVAGVVSTTLLDLRDEDVLAGVARFPRLTAVLLPLLIRLQRVTDAIAPPPWLMEKMNGIANDPELVRLCVNDERGGATRLPMRFYRTLFQAQPALEPEEFDRPVLVLHPGADRMTPISLTRDFVDRLPNGRLIQLPGCGHFPVEEPGASLLQRELAEFALGFGADAAADGGWR